MLGTVNSFVAKIPSMDLSKLANHNPHFHADAGFLKAEVQNHGGSMLRRYGNPGEIDGVRFSGFDSLILVLDFLFP